MRVSGRSVPLRNARFFINTKNMGTKISTWTVEVIIPPTIGAAIGFITSEPILMRCDSCLTNRLAQIAEALVNLSHKEVV
jgi:hypothetical protein